MTVTREQLLKIGKLIHDIKLKNLKCNINLEYKILKLENIIKEEFEMTNILLNDLSLKYAELDDNKEPIIKDGGIKIITEQIINLQQELSDFYKATIQLPDYYFSLDELEELNLDWEKTEAFIPFIKEQFNIM